MSATLRPPAAIDIMTMIQIMFLERMELHHLAFLSKKLKVYYSEYTILEKSAKPFPGLISATSG